jgi:hypothetical protein
MGFGNSPNYSLDLNTKAREDLVSVHGSEVSSGRGEL